MIKEIISANLPPNNLASNPLYPSVILSGG
jgi:hypothetical protein